MATIIFYHLLPLIITKHFAPFHFNCDLGFRYPAILPLPWCAQLLCDGAKYKLRRGRIQTCHIDRYQAQEISHESKVVCAIGCILSVYNVQWYKSSLVSSPQVSLGPYYQSLKRLFLLLRLDVLGSDVLPLALPKCQWDFLVDSVRAHTPRLLLSQTLFMPWLNRLSNGQPPSLQHCYRGLPTARRQSHHQIRRLAFASFFGREHYTAIVNLGETSWETSGCECRGLTCRQECRPIARLVCCPAMQFWGAEVQYHCD